MGCSHSITASELVRVVVPKLLRQHILLWGFPHSSVGKESACNAADLSLIPKLGRSPGKGKGYLLQYSGLETSIDYTVYGVAKRRTQLSDFHFHFHDPITIYLVVLGLFSVGLLLLLCFLPREVPLAFVVKLVWWC